MLAPGKVRHTGAMLLPLSVGDEPCTISYSKVVP
jgi:hypothetical protein